MIDARSLLAASAPVAVGLSSLLVGLGATEVVAELADDGTMFSGIIEGLLAGLVIIVLGALVCPISLRWASRRLLGRAPSLSRAIAATVAGILVSSVWCGGAVATGWSPIMAAGTVTAPFLAVLVVALVARLGPAPTAPPVAPSP